MGKFVESFVAAFIAALLISSLLYSIGKRDNQLDSSSGALILVASSIVGFALVRKRRLDKGLRLESLALITGGGLASALVLMLALGEYEGGPVTFVLRLRIALGLVGTFLALGTFGGAITMLLWPSQPRSSRASSP